MSTRRLRYPHHSRLVAGVRALRQRQPLHCWLAVAREGERPRRSLSRSPGGTTTYLVRSQGLLRDSCARGRAPTGGGWGPAARTDSSAPAPRCATAPLPTPTGTGTASATYTPAR